MQIIFMQSLLVRIYVIVCITFHVFVYSLDCHIVEIEVFGPGEGENRFHVKTVRTNPAKSGVVTGNATYSSFLSSMLGMYSWLVYPVTIYIIFHHLPNSIFFQALVMPNLLTSYTTLVFHNTVVV